MLRAFRHQLLGIRGGDSLQLRSHWGVSRRGGRFCGWERVLRRVGKVTRAWEGGGGKERRR
jgi:hypothetical protein